MPTYYEIDPPQHLREAVECFWISVADSRRPTVGSPVRVFPDGCADVIYTRSGGRSALSFVGAMTGYRDFGQPSDGFSVGVRFHPAAWSEILRVNGYHLGDRFLPLRDVSGSLGNVLGRLDDVDCVEQVPVVLADALPALSFNPVQRAISALVRSGGSLGLDDVASAAGLTSRQFRRRCLQMTSLSPKMLSRIVRFRRAKAELSRTLDLRQAEVAAVCGFSDESHFIAEFQCFAGKSPGCFRRGMGNISSKSD